MDQKVRELYLKAEHQFYSRVDFESALQYADSAIGLDSNYAPPHAIRALVYNQMASLTRGVSPHEMRSKAIQAAERAIELDETEDRAHAVLGNASASYEFDWPRADYEFQRAFELNPSSIPGLVLSGFVFAWLGRYDEALECGRRAMDLDPLHIGMQHMFTVAFSFAGLHDEAVRQALELIELYPSIPSSHQRLALAYMGKGMYDEAVAAFEKADSLAGTAFQGAKGWMGFAYGILGERDRATDILEALIERADSEYVSPTAIAAVYVGLGDHARALDYLEEGYRVRDSNMITLKEWHEWDPLRSEPRFQALLSQMNLSGN